MNSAIELRMMKSLTTATEILNCPGAPVEATEYTSRSFAIEIKSDKINVDQLVSFSGQIRLGDLTFQFEATGKVISCQPLETDLCKIEIYLHQFDKSLWSEFLKHREQSQNRVDQLFKKIKGEN